MQDSTQEIPFLIASSGPLFGSNWPVNRNLLIGRDADCDIVINDRQVSRQHARLIVGESQEIQIEDQDSKNGTYVNGKRITPSLPLKDGDEIKIALIQTFVFVSSDATIPLQEDFSPSKQREKALVIDEKARSVWIDGRELSPPLSVSQYRLLYVLYQFEGDVVRRADIVNHVWGAHESAGVSEQAIDALVRRLRNRIQDIDPDYEYIKTIRGVGFIFENRNIE